MADAKEVAAKSAEDKRKTVDEFNAQQGKPTPTQEECDLAMLGVPFETHEDDGSGPSPEYRMTRVNRQSEAQKPTGGSYTTRSAAPAAKEPPKPAS
jgi:hypothetical protein